jgi:hypothetical protein
MNTICHFNSSASNYGTLSVRLGSRRRISSRSTASKLPPIDACTQQQYYHTVCYQTLEASEAWTCEAVILLAISSLYWRDIRLLSPLKPLLAWCKLYCHPIMLLYQRISMVCLRCCRLNKTTHRLTMALCSVKFLLSLLVICRSFCTCCLSDCPVRLIDMLLSISFPVSRWIL